MADQGKEQHEPEFFAVPTIDLQNAPEDEIVHQIATACHEYGFFQIVNHSIPRALIDSYLEQCRLYFALPLDVKRQWKRNDGNARGWFNDELTKQRLDWKEALDMGVPGTRDWNVPDDRPDNRCLDGWNQLPGRDVLPDFRPVITEYFDACAELSHEIAVLMAKGLGQDENASMIQELQRQHSSYLRSNYYPLCNQVDDDGSKPLGISPHRDAGFLTVLLQDADCHSLQVWKDDRWVTIHPQPYAITINTGDMAEVWSNGRYKAPLHRVLSHETQVRYSTPFFYNPPYATRVEPVVAVTGSNSDDNDEEKTNQPETPMYLGVLWGYFRAVRFAGDLTDLGVEIQVADFFCDNPSPHVRKQEMFAEQADFGVPFSVEKYRPLLQENFQDDDDDDGNKAKARKNGKSSGGSPSTSSLMTMLAMCLIFCVSFLPTVVESSTRSPLVSRNPFSKERTGVSGFGSRSIRKTIFSTAAILTDEKEKVNDNVDEDISSDDAVEEESLQNKVLPQVKEDEGGDFVQDEDSDNEGEFKDRYEDILTTTGSNRLWVQRSMDDPGILWVLVGSENDSKKTTLKLSVSKNTSDWQVERRSPSRRFLKQYPIEQWVPIEGFYGLYRVPSGTLWVLISKTEPVYSAPPFKESLSSSWLEIRRIVNLEIVHLSNDNVGSLSPFQLREEVRQLKLLRKALKQHDFYYVPQSQNGAQARHSPFLFSDMTKTLQRSILERKDDEASEPWWREKQLEEEVSSNQPDPRFFWNQHAVEPLIRRYRSSSKISPKRKLVDVLLQNVFPVTSAFVGLQRNITVDSDDKKVKKTAKNKKQNSRITYDEVLISRRSRFRAGTRFTVRGADASGAVANFVESEQLCFSTKENEAKERYLDSVASHVQIRGSIPLRWSSPADVKTYRPRVRIGTDPIAQARALRLHLLEQLSLYASQDFGGRSPNVADVVFVNLVDKKSDQGRLGKAFDSVLNAVMDVYGIESKNLTCDTDKCLRRNSVQHLWYDFHAEVKDGRWDRLCMLLDEVQPSLMSHGYFLANAPSKSSDGAGWEIKRLQNAVVRTNCMDCLDRTNVVQSIFGRYMLFQQLSSMAGEWFTSTPNANKSNRKLWADFNTTFRKNAMALPWQNGEVAHRLIWADNADAISRLYAGTPALKGDFTRTGKRTKRGALDDGMNSLQRYYLNNFLDADRQEGYDLLVGYSNFSNVGEIPLEDEELAYQEKSDVEQHGNGTSTNNDDAEALAGQTMSLYEAAREKMLSDVVRSDSYRNRKDVQSRLQDIGIPKPSPEAAGDESLDLRWLPGDLQTHLRSQAESTSSLAETNGDGLVSSEDSTDDTTSTRHVYDFQKALQIIDERSTQFLPWWAAESPEMSDEGQDVLDSSDNVSIPQRQDLSLTNPIVLTIVLILANQSPSTLAGIALVLLSVVYLPAIVKGDMQQRSRIEGLVAKLQRNKES